MVTDKDVLDVFPGAKVVDPKDVARRSNIPTKVEKPQDREARADDGDADRKARIAQVKTRVRRQQAQQGRLFE